MITSSITPPTEEVEGAEVDVVEWAGKVTVSVCGRFSQSWALPHLTNTALMAPITMK